jgi:hypothetical protein
MTRGQSAKVAENEADLNANKIKKEQAEVRLRPLRLSKGGWFRTKTKLV